jgi:transcriptional regulator with XRE-family HTH domain
MARPVFHNALGDFFRSIREAKGWSLRQTATLAANRKIGSVSYQSLQRLEAGKAKNPEPDLLKALAKLYAVPYQTLVDKWVEHTFDLTRHSTDQSSGSSSHVGDPLNDPAATRMELERLRTIVARYDEEVRKMRALADDVFNTAIALEQVRTTAEEPPNRRSNDRKVG